MQKLDLSGPEDARDEELKSEDGAKTRALRNELDLLLGSARAKIGEILPEVLGMTNREFKRSCRELVEWRQESIGNVVAGAAVASLSGVVQHLGVPQELLESHIRAQLGLIVPEAADMRHREFAAFCCERAAWLETNVPRLQAAAIAEEFLRRRECFLGNCTCRSSGEEEMERAIAQALAELELLVRDLEGDERNGARIHKDPRVTR